MLTCLQVGHPQRTAEAVIHSPATLSLLCSTLRHCFEFDRSAAVALSFATSDGGAHASQQLPTPQLNDPAAASSSPTTAAACRHCQHCSRACNQQG